MIGPSNAPGDVRPARSLRSLTILFRVLRLLTGSTLKTDGAIVLAYHDIGNDPENATDYYLSPQRLRQQLSASMQWGLRFVDLGELVSNALKEGDAKGLAAIVFDDGLVGVHHHALPVIAELGLPATVFAVTEHLGSTPPWWDGAARLMTWAEIKELAANGFRVASHSRTHASLPRLDSRGLRVELRDSRCRIQDSVGEPVDLFAYPYGHHNQQVRDATREAGYRAAFSFQDGRIIRGLDPYRIPRLGMSAKYTKLRLAHVLSRPTHWWSPQLDESR
jgi:peptidoglycan/xylan/chitin deacetylase (PgdA/CDA1 family)